MVNIILHKYPVYIYVYIYIRKCVCVSVYKENTNREDGEAFGHLIVSEWRGKKCVTGLGTGHRRSAEIRLLLLLVRTEQRA